MKQCYPSHDEQKLEHCLDCGKKINLSYIEKLKKRAEKISIEKKQEILDLLHSGNTIGETIKKSGVDNMVLGQIILDNMESEHSLSKVVL